MKSRATDFGENHLLGKVAGFTDEDAGGLGHAFDDQAVRDNREGRVKIVQMLFSQRNVFDRRRGGARRELGEFVDPDPAHDFGLHYGLSLFVNYVRHVVFVQRPA